VHRYAEAGEYDVTLTLATFDGRVGTDSKRIAVQ
jgi:PKD repeat protein